MTPYQTAYLCVSIAAFALAWCGGGHPERRAVVGIVLAYVLSVVVEDIGSERIRWAVMLVDLSLSVFLLRLALIHDRWWLLLACASMLLAMLAHVSMFLDPDITLRVNIATRWAFGFFLMVALGLGVAERRWAGETAVFADWLKSRASTA